MMQVIRDLRTRNGGPRDAGAGRDFGCKRDIFLATASRVLRGSGWACGLVAGLFGPMAALGCGGAKPQDVQATEGFRDLRDLYCSSSGNDMIEVDGNGDGRVDIRQYTRDGVLRCATYDLNHNGRLDMTQVYDENGTTLLQSVYDFDFDGRPDQITYYSAGKARQHHLDTDFDRVIDTWITCDEDGWVSGIERQRHRGPGGRDTFEVYERGVLAAASYDTNRSGAVDRWEVYEEGRLIKVRFDDNGDGNVDREDEVEASTAVGVMKPFSCESSPVGFADGAAAPNRPAQSASDAAAAGSASKNAADKAESGAVQGGQSDEDPSEDGEDSAGQNNAAGGDA